MSHTPDKRAGRALTQTLSNSRLLQDDMQPVYAQRAQQMASGEAHGDWPEVYVLAIALGCRIDVFWPLDEPDKLARYVLHEAEPTLRRWCLLREAQSWTPLVGSVPDVDTWSADAAMAMALVTPDGPDALFDALATLSLLMPARSQPVLSSAQLRQRAADALLQQGSSPYAQRDSKLMHMLALTRTQEAPGKPLVF